MSIKCALVAIVACCVAAGSANAQSTTERPRARAAMWTALQLTESQDSRVKAIHGKYASAIKAAQQLARDSAARVNDRELAEVRNILSLEQQQTFDSYMTGKKRPRRGSVARVMPVKIGISH